MGRSARRILQHVTEDPRLVCKRVVVRLVDHDYFEACVNSSGDSHTSNLFDDADDLDQLNLPILGGFALRMVQAYWRGKKRRRIYVRTDGKRRRRVRASPPFEILISSRGILDRQVVA